MYLKNRLFPFGIINAQALVYQREAIKMTKHPKRAWLPLALVLLILAGVVTCMWTLNQNLVPGSSKNSSGTGIHLGASTLSSENYRTIPMDQDDIHQGLLILVNNDHAYSFPQESNLVSVYQNKNKSYQVSTTGLLLQKDFLTQFNAMMKDFSSAQGIKDIIVVSGYRSKEDQQSIVDQKIQQLGKEEAMRWATVPGYSEHHTGLAADIGIYTSDGKSPSYQGQGKYAWINEHCAQYGFILRYQDDKKDITKIADEPWHYRYVGTPHASIMQQENLCLEEYTDYLKRYPFDGKHLTASDESGKQYEIYYVGAKGKTVDVPVPNDKEYWISGNNVDGFVVTVQL